MSSNNATIIKKFLSKQRIDNFDIIKNNYKSRVTRGSLNIVNKDERQLLYTKPKEMTDFNKISLEDPFKLDEYKNYNKTDIQKQIDILADKMNFIGNMALSCPCGGGKTLAGISLMSKVNFQTLIISTRCAINDQWRDTLLKTYKDKIKIQTREGLFYYNNKNKLIRKTKKYAKDNNIIPDVYIYSPQYLSQKIEKFPISVGLIIYDEIHSQLSKEYSKVLMYPFQNVMNNTIKELPYMVGLSATYPSSNSNEYKMIKAIFGNPMNSISSITDIPIKVYDIRDYIKKSSDEFDRNYIPFEDNELIDKIVNNEIGFYNKRIEPTILSNDKVCGFVITSSIKSSVYAWIKFYLKYPNKKCILIRENQDGCYLLKNDIPKDIIELGDLVDYEDIINHDKFDEFCDKVDNFYGYDILIGTYHRLKEGISVYNAVWGICTKFVWSIATRIQILGRIRRMTNDDFINNYQRYFLVNSAKIPTNIGEILKIKRYSRYKKNIPKLEITYDLEEEKQLFIKENYIQIKPKDN